MDSFFYLHLLGYATSERIFYANHVLSVFLPAPSVGQLGIFCFGASISSIELLVESAKRDVHGPKYNINSITI